jgi:hypothetical protein
VINNNSNKNNNNSTVAILDQAILA